MQPSVTIPVSWQAVLQSTFVYRGNCSYLWDTELRPGNVGTWDGSVELLETCFFNIPPDMRELRVRADAGLGFNPADPSLQRARNSRHSRASSTRDDHPMCLYKRVPAACSKLFGSKLKNLRAMWSFRCEGEPSRWC